MAKGKKEKQKEEVQFATYKQFCDDTEAEKERLIKNAGEKLDGLAADIEKYTEDAARLTKEIAGHNDDIAAWTGDVKATTAVRAIEKGDYDKTHKDYSESIDALERALAVLKKQAYDRKQASSLLQVSALQKVQMIPADAQKAIASFLSEDDGDDAVPEANAYENQSG